MQYRNQERNKKILSVMLGITTAAIISSCSIGIYEFTKNNDKIKKYNDNNIIQEFKYNLPSYNSNFTELTPETTIYKK